MSRNTSRHIDEADIRALERMLAEAGWDVGSANWNRAQVRLTHLREARRHRHNMMVGIIAILVTIVLAVLFRPHDSATPPKPESPSPLPATPRQQTPAQSLALGTPTAVPNVTPSDESSETSSDEQDIWVGQLPGMLAPDPSVYRPNRWANGYYHNEVLNNTNFLITYKTVGSDYK